jgi:hypothetical protein
LSAEHSRKKRKSCEEASGTLSMTRHYGRDSFSKGLLRTVLISTAKATNTSLKLNCLSTDWQVMGRTNIIAMDSFGNLVAGGTNGSWTCGRRSDKQPGSVHDYILNFPSRERKRKGMQEKHLLEYADTTIENSSPLYLRKRVANRARKMRKIQILGTSIPISLGAGSQHKEVPISVLKHPPLFYSFSSWVV